MANIIEVIVKANDQTGGTFNKLNSSFKSLTGFSLSAAGGIAMAGMAISKAVEYTKQAIVANDKYVSSIVDMARFTGDQTDAMSRLVQVADDAFLSQEALNNAMSIGAKKGLDMSVQGIKDLADQYNSLATVQEKNKLLNDNFGRSGLAMGKLLEQGSAGITKNMEAIADNLVVTDKSVKITYDYKRSVDALNDAMDGLKYTVAQKAMPVITDFNIVTTALIEKLDLAKKKTYLFDDSIAGTIANIYTSVNGIQLFTIALSLLADKLDKTKISTSEASDLYQAHRGYVEGATIAIDEFAIAQLNAAAASEALQEEYETVTGLAQNLTTSDQELLTAETDLAEYIKNNPWDTTGIETRKTKIEELKAAQQKMVDAWFLNVFTTMALADGEMTRKEAAFLLQYQLDTGMIDEENMKRAQSYWDMAGEVFAANAQIKSSIDGLQGKDIFINVRYNDSGIGSIVGGPQPSSGGGNGISGTPKKKFADGGSFTVGSSYGYEGFNMGGIATASAGEKITVTPQNASTGLTKSDLRSAFTEAMSPIMSMMMSEFAKLS